MKDKFDYIIVGAGSAGCVLANRLSAQSDSQVLLIEAGPKDSSPLIAIPKGFGKLLSDPSHAWFYDVEPMAGSNVNKETWARGKMLGGSSSINGMVYMRGHPLDYDEWSDMGLTAWSWENLAPHFKAMEDHVLGESDHRGSGGPLGITLSQQSEFSQAFFRAADAVGLPYQSDLNALDHLGVGPVSTNIKQGRRQSASYAFLRPVKDRSNLTIITDTLVDRVLIDNGVATGVECICRGQRRTLTAAREVILSAGALSSPLILQRSGIGAAKHLQQLGITPVVDCPAVGANLREHRLLFMQYKLKRPVSQNFEYSGWRLVKNALRYLLFRTGLLAECNYSAGGFAHTGINLHDPRPDMEILLAPFSLNMDNRLTFENHHGISIFGYLCRPSSQGSVQIRSNRVEDNPVIYANYLATDYDRKTSAAMIRFLRRLMSQQALKPWLAQETTPGPKVQTDEAIIDAFARMGQSGYHACGTCRMGVDGDAVVDGRLRVNGVRGLRIMDLSVAPTMISGNTNAPMMAMASRAAALILEDRE